MGIRINGSTSGYTELTAPAVANNTTFTLPDSTGSADQVLTTDGNGGLSFTTLQISNLDVITIPSLNKTSFDVGNTASITTAAAEAVTGSSGTISYATYQWQIQGNGGTNFVNSGTNSTLTVPSTINDSGTTRNVAGGKIRCQVTFTDNSTPPLTSGTVTTTVSGVNAFRVSTTYPPSSLWYRTGSGTSWTYPSSTLPSGGVINVANGTTGSWVVQNGGLLYSNYAQDFSSQFLRVNTYDRANRTITAIVDGHGNPIGPFILYDDGSIRMASGTIRQPGTNKVVRLDGTAGVGAGAWAITEDGGLLFPGAMTSVSQAFSEGDVIHPLPTGVKLLCIQQCAGGGTGYAATGVIMLGDDSKLYSAGNTGITSSGVNNSATLTNGGAALFEPVAGKTWISITGNISNTGYWGYPGLSALTIDNELYHSYNGSAFTKISDDVLQTPEGNGYGGTTSSFPGLTNKQYKNLVQATYSTSFDTMVGPTSTQAQWDKLKVGAGARSTVTYTTTSQFFLIPN